MTPNLTPIRRAIVRGFALGLVGCALANAALADPPAHVGRLAFSAGSVSLAMAAGAAPESVALNWPVTGGNVLQTGPSGRAEVTVGSLALRLDVDTEVDVEQLDDQHTRLRVPHGSVAVRATDAGDAAAVDIETPLGELQPTAAGGVRVDVRDGRIDATVWRGSARFAGSGASYSFVSGQRAELVHADGSVQVAMLMPASDDFQRFVQYRDRQAPTAPRYVSAEMTGADALDAYGQWQVSADDGPVWVPSVAADWAPYRVGSWTWVDPWGWTWVDAAPWGFAPFHYGRWTRWDGRWAWVPGSYVARPVYAPALVAWRGGMPPAPGVSVGIAAGAGFALSASVGWFPLAPHEVYVPPYSVSTTYVRNVNITHVTDVTVINQAVQQAHAPAAAGAGAVAAARPLRFANDAQATTQLPVQALHTRQPVPVHGGAPVLAAAAPHAVEPRGGAAPGGEPQAPKPAAAADTRGPMPAEPAARRLPAGAAERDAAPLPARTAGEPRRSPTPMPYVARPEAPHEAARRPQSAAEHEHEHEHDRRDE